MTGTESSCVRVLTSAMEEMRPETVTVETEVVVGRTLNVSGARSDDDVLGIPADSGSIELGLGRDKAWDGVCVWWADWPTEEDKGTL